MKKLKVICLFAVACMLAAGCFQSKYTMVRYCIPTKKSHKAIDKRSDYTVLKASDIKRMLVDDTEHYKVAIVYSACNGFGIRQPKKDYMEFIRSLDTNKCKVYFILNDCSTVAWNDEVLNEIGVKTRYIFHDNDERYIDLKDTKEGHEHWINLVNDLFHPQYADIDAQTVPMVLFVNPQGQLKWAKHINQNGTTYRPYDPVEANGDLKADPTTLDYNRLEVVDHTK
ncbi:MAG: hypothetical protein IJ761_00395 [Bacteroidales bacterium]|nr:hypothetical protein [Bacteroidales bacterium]